MAIGPAVGLSSEDEGVKQIQQLIKKANAGVNSITDAKRQLQKTMNAYNADRVTAAANNNITRLSAE
jgi:hypothetical protein